MPAIQVVRREIEAFTEEVRNERDPKRIKALGDVLEKLNERYERLERELLEEEGLPCAHGTATQRAEVRRAAIDDGIVRGYVLAVATLAHNPAASSPQDLQSLLRAGAITRSVAVAAGVDIDLKILDDRKGWPEEPRDG